MDQAARQHRRRAIRGQSVPPKTSDRTPPDRRHTRPGPGCAAPGVRPAIPRCPTAVRAAGANHPSSSRTATRQATPTTDTPAPRPGRSVPILPACNRDRSRARPARQIHRGCCDQAVSWHVPRYAARSTLSTDAQPSRAGDSMRNTWTIGRAWKPRRGGTDAADRRPRTTGCRRMRPGAGHRAVRSGRPRAASPAAPRLVAMERTYLGTAEPLMEQGVLPDWLDDVFAGCAVYDSSRVRRRHVSCCSMRTADII